MQNGTLFRFDVCAKMRRPYYCVIILLLKKKELVISSPNLKNSIKVIDTGGNGNEIR